MTLQELREKASHMRKFKIKLGSYYLSGEPKYTYGDLEHYFNSEDIEIGYYSHIFKTVHIFEGGRVWHKCIKNKYELCKCKNNDG